MNEQNIFYTPNRFAPDPNFYQLDILVDPNGQDKIFPVDTPVKVDPSYLPPNEGSIEVQPIRSMLYAGHVVDADTGSPVPFASVFGMVGKEERISVMADGNGYFALTPANAIETIVISSVGYKAWEWPADPSQGVFKLQKDVKDIEPVILPPGTTKKTNWILLLVIGGIVYQIAK